MTRDQIFLRVQNILVEMFELDEKSVTIDAHLVNDLGLDSIDAIDMVVKLQELIGKRVEESALRRVRTVRDVIDMVELQLTSKPDSALDNE